jgi:hypothetical protein
MHAIGMAAALAIDHLIVRAAQRAARVGAGVRRHDMDSCRLERQSKGGKMTNLSPRKTTGVLLAPEVLSHGCARANPEPSEGQLCLKLGINPP